MSNIITVTTDNNSKYYMDAALYLLQFEKELTFKTLIWYSPIFIATKVKDKVYIRIEDEEGGVSKEPTFILDVKIFKEVLFLWVKGNNIEWAVNTIMDTRNRSNIYKEVLRHLSSEEDIVTVKMWGEDSVEYLLYDLTTDPDCLEIAEKKEKVQIYLQEQNPVLKGREYYMVTLTDTAAMSNGTFKGGVITNIHRKILHRNEIKDLDNFILDIS